MEKTISLKSPDKVIYFDNGATSFPKPGDVASRVYDYIAHSGGNPGRSGHEKSFEAGDMLFSARDMLAELFGVRNPMHVIFTLNATDALNMAISGLVKKGDHVITTSMEHNSTIRPLKALEQKGMIELCIVECSPQGRVATKDLEKQIKHNTAAFVINHGSNVCGMVQPLKEIGALCKSRGISLIADCAQTAGIIDINMDEMNIDLLAFAGHKGLYGPTGTGGLIISDAFDCDKLEPLRYGGTGSFSDKVTQPEFLPDKYESGTLNVAGIAGLSAGLEYIAGLEKGVTTIRDHKKELVRYFYEMCSANSGFEPVNHSEEIETGVVSFNIKGMESSETAMLLAEDHNILCRAGLHCAPLAHQTLGTFPHGTVRFSFGIFNTKKEIDTAAAALEKISQKG